ncbi:MAG: type IX secretion system protein PorQ [Saprospiraceae bacterium]|nr:type IX secretion system protein PorQ [Saprospiraceae bacterium]
MTKQYLFIGLIMCLICTFTQLSAQIGGNSTYEFLRIPHSARITGLGGSAIAVMDNDINLAYQNPATLNPAMHGQLSFQQSTYFAGSTHGYLTYGHQISKLPLMVQGGMQYISYGKFTQATQNGIQTGSFGASEFGINIGAAYQLSDRFSVGTNIRTILSYIESYNSTGMSADLGAVYNDTSKNLTIGLTFRNIGSQFTTYDRNGNLERLPFDIQLGISHRLRYLPLRFGVILHNLQRWGILYDDPNQQDQTLFIDPNNPPSENKAGKFFDNAFRHFIFNLEFLIGKRDKEILFLRMAYNHHRRGELSVKGLVGGSGFSGGLGIRIRNFRIDYGIASYHFAGAVHHFGLTVDINEFKRG